INADGIPDLAVYAQDTALAQSALVTFVSASGVALAARNSAAYNDLTYQIALGDMDGDGILEVLTADWLYQTASGFKCSALGSLSLASATVTGTALRPTAIVAADFDGDGALDAATAHWDYELAPSLTVLKGNLGGGFASLTNYVSGGYSYSLAAGDFDGDFK